MRRSRKIWLIITGLALLACLAVFVSWPEKSVTNLAGGPSFEARVEKPRIARPLFGILPVRLEERLEPGGELRFDHTSPGAKIGSVRPNRLELSADGWDLLVETDGQGRIARGTRLVYKMALAEKQRTLRCRPADRATGYLRATPRVGSDALDGRFLVEFAACENAETGKDIEWPPAPLTVRGSFGGLPQGAR
jgi:hypothetical protein